MISIVLLIVSFCITHASSGNNSKLSYLVLASRVSRGYMPETHEARQRVITTTVDSLTYHAPEMRNAVKSKLIASYSFLALLRPLIQIYGELCSLYFVSGQKPGRIGKSLQTALQRQSRGVTSMLKSLKESHEVLPSWSEEAEVAFDRVTRCVAEEVDQTYVLFNSLVSKPSLKMISAVRNQLCKNSIALIFDLIDGLQMKAMAQDLALLQPIALLHAMSSHFVVNEKDSGDMMRLALGYYCNRALAEVRLLPSTKKTAHNVRKDMRSFVLSSALFAEYLRRGWAYPELNFPASNVAENGPELVHVVECVQKKQTADEERERAVKRWANLIDRIFAQSLKVTPQDLTDISTLSSDLYDACKTFAEASKTAAVTRLQCIVDTLENLA